MNGDFDNLNELFDHNTGRPNNTQQDVDAARRSQDLAKYDAFNKKHASIVDNRQKEIDETFGQYCDEVSSRLIQKYGDRSRSIQTAKFWEVVNKERHIVVAEVNAHISALSRGREEYDNIVRGKSYMPFQDFLSYVDNSEKTSTRRLESSIEKTVETLGGLTAPSAPSAPSPNPAPSAPSAPSPNPAPGFSGSPEFKQVWGKHRNSLLAMVKQDVNGGRNAQDSITDALKFLGVKTSQSTFDEILDKIANELGLTVERENGKTENEAEIETGQFAQIIETREERKRRILKEYFRKLKETGIEDNGINPYSEDQAWKYAKDGRTFGRSIRAIETYIKLKKEFPNVSLEAVGRLARERNMFFHPAYIQSLYETNPDLERHEGFSGQEFIDFYALSEKTSKNAGSIESYAKARNIRERRKHVHHNTGKLFSVVDFLNAFSRRGVVGVAQYVAGIQGGGGVKNAFQDVDPSAVKKILDDVREEVKQATNEDGSVNLSKITNPDVYDLVSSGNFVKTAYNIAKRNAFYSEPGSAQGLPRRTKKSWRRPEIPFRKIKDGFSFAFGAAQSGAHRVLDPPLKAAGSAWQAVKDDFNGVWGIDDEEFQRILEEKKQKFPFTSPEPNDSELLALIEEKAKLEGKRGATVFEDGAPAFTDEDEERLKKLDRLIEKKKREQRQRDRKRERADRKARRWQKRTEKWENKYKEKKSREAGSAPQAPEPSPATSPENPSGGNAPSASNVETDEFSEIPKWKVEAIDSAGKPFTDVAIGFTSDQVVSDLESLGYKVVKIEPFKDRKPAKRREAGGSPSSPSSPGSPSGSGGSSGDYELDPDGFTVHYKTKSGSAPGGGSPTPGGLGGWARVFGLIAALTALIAVVNKVKQKLDQMSSATHSFNDKFSQYNATISGYKLQQDAAAFKRDVKTAAEAANPYADGTTPQGIMTKASIEWEDSKAGLASAWNRKTAPLKSWAMEGFSNFNEDLTTILNPKGIGDFFSGLIAPVLSNDSHDSTKERIAFGIDKVIEKLTGIEGFAKESAEERKEEKNAQSGGIKASALLRAIETMGDLKATSGFMQTNSPSNNWTAGFKTEGQYGRDASSPSKKYGSGLTYHTRKE